MSRNFISIDITKKGLILTTGLVDYKNKRNYNISKYHILERNNKRGNKYNNRKNTNMVNLQKWKGD